jgi:tRNA uridine 5-carbamoylmethylation protein Kti12
MALLIVTRGLPGSGKTTRARVWVAQDPTNRARVNRDDLRDMLHDGWLGTDEQEDQITAAQHVAVEALLRRGLDVVCDDTNLLDEYVLALRQVAEQAGAGFEVWDMTHVPVEVCIARDEERALEGGHHIGEKAIRRMHRQYMEGQRAAA